MLIAVLQSGTSSHVMDAIYAIKRNDMEAFVFSENDSVDNLIKAYGFIIVDGYVGQNSQLIVSTLKTQAALGKPLLGIGNGSSLLLESGLIPGVANDMTVIKLVSNQHPLPLEVRIRLGDDYQYNAFTRCLTLSQIMPTSITTLENCFVVPPGLLIEIESQGLDVFQYCDEAGMIVRDSGKNIAAIANKAGNVMAMMPHIETSLGGDAIFKSMREHILERHIEHVAPLYYWPR